MFNFKNGAFLLGLLTGIVLTALLGIFVLMLVQVTRPTQTTMPEPTAPITPTATVTLTVAPTNTATVTLTVAPTNTVTVTLTVAPTNTVTVTPTVAPTNTATVTPTVAPTNTATVTPTVAPTNTATVTPTVGPTNTATVTLTVAPTNTATVTPTVGPTNTATVMPTSQPTAAPTAVPVSAPTDFPFRNFPTPLPTPVTVPFNGGTQGMGVNLASVSLDDVPQNALQVKPEQVFDVAMDYNVWSILEPIPGGDNSGRCASTCIVNLTVGMVSSDGSYKPLFCIYQGTPGNEPGVQSSWSSPITTPTTPGVYGLRLDYHLTYNCEQALADVDPGRPGISLATIRVEPIAAPAGEPTIGPTAVPASEQRVPKTGQTQCWDANGNLIACAGTGEDGEYQKGIDPVVAPTCCGTTNAYNTPAWTGVRFTDNGDGTVTDNLTGLIWLRNANCFGPESTVWALALTDASTLNSSECGLTDGSVEGNWRLPNVNELHSLIDLRQSNPALPAGHPFSGVQSRQYWTSTTLEAGTSSAWLVDLNGGWVNYNFKGGISYVWPVRGGQ